MDELIRSNFFSLLLLIGVNFSIASQSISRFSLFIFSSDFERIKFLKFG